MVAVLSWIQASGACWQREMASPMAIVLLSRLCRMAHLPAGVVASVHRGTGEPDHGLGTFQFAMQVDRMLGSQVR
jgi:hypothetical protein